MGHMKDFLITIHNGGDEAVAAVQRIGEDWRLQLEAAAGEIERLRSLTRFQDGVIRSGDVACLTEAEREAVARSAAAWEADARMGLSDGGVAATMRGLLERLR